MTWNEIETIPTDRPVIVQSVSGLECLAMVQRGVRHIKPANQYGPKRVACFRKDKSGDVMAVKWKDA